jgi:hypothetical protein
MLFRRRRAKAPQERAVPGASAVVSEAEWYLSGKYLEYLYRNSRPIPVWAWINPLAHGTVADLRALAARRSPADPADSWTAAVFLLARSVLAAVGTDEAALTRLQSRVLAPLELELTDRESPTFGPADLVAVVLGSLV